MKSYFKLFFWLSLVMLLLNSRSSQAAVSLNISPASITNDYVGKITLTISGLTSGQAVQVERIYDVNSNGIIGPGDFAIQTFKLTDGQLPLLGGVRNLNVPGDDDGTANGQIVTKLDYPGLSNPSGGTTGSFIINVADQQTGASLATHVFSVAQKVYPQGVSGRITSAATGLPVTNTPAVLFNIAGKGSALIAITDTNGNYSFFSPVGNYSVLVAESPFISDESAGFVTIVTNQFATKNLSVASGTFTISGHLTDSVTGKSNGVVFLNGQSTNNLFTGVFTDTNGSYSLPVNSNQWQIDIDKGALAQRGYLAPQSKPVVTISNSSVSNFNFSVTRATALIFGTVKDTLTNNIIGLSMTATDNGGLFEAQGMTETNGAYTLGVVGDTWDAGPDSSALQALGYSGNVGTNVTLTDGSSAEADFLLQGVNAHIRGQVKDDHGIAITNIQIVVQPFPLQGNGANSIYPSTDGSGNFDAGVTGGAWNIALECVSAEQRGYVNVSGFNFNVTNGVDLNGLQLVFPQSTATISGKLTNSSGQGIEGITLNASQPINSTNAYFPGCVSTDVNGNYQIRVLGGTWNVMLANGTLNALGYSDISPTNVTIVGNAATANFVALFALVPPKFVGGSNASGGGLTLNLIGDIGHTNGVQFSSNLVTWFALTNRVLNTTNWQVFDPSITNHDHRFYRAFVSP